MKQTQKELKSAVFCWGCEFTTEEETVGLGCDMKRKQNTKKNYQKTTRHENDCELGTMVLLRCFSIRCISGDKITRTTTHGGFLDMLDVEEDERVW